MGSSNASATVDDTWSMPATALGTLLLHDTVEVLFPAQQQFTSDDGQQTFMEYRFLNVRLIADRPIYDGQHGLLEEVSFIYEEIEWTYFEFDPVTGEFEGEVTATWKVEEGESEAPAVDDDSAELLQAQYVDAGALVSAVESTAG